MKKKLFYIFVLLVLTGVILNRFLPDRIVLTEFSSLADGEILSYASSNDENTLSETVGEKEVTLELFGKIPIKTVDVSVVPEKQVYVSGEAVGIRIYSDGIMVINVEGLSGADLSGIKKGDIIESVNGIKCHTTEEIKAILEKNETNTLQIKRGKTRFSVKVKGKYQNTGYKTGMWVRDSAAGIGTLTYVTEEGAFGALGHAICDSTTEDIVPLYKGSVADCTVRSVRLGKPGEPGEIEGTISREVTGIVSENTNLGIYGTTPKYKGKKIPVATRYSIRQGEATILCNVDGEGVKSYLAEITNVSKSQKVNNKGLELRITDKNLLKKTGGIVQGMSGSPIIQNGKLVGAVTHVFVNDPTRGNGIFIENMLEAEKVK